MIKLTETDVRHSFCVISIPYCNADDLLRHLPTHFYTSGAYGWKSDIYIVGNYAISTGYQPVSGVKPNQDMIFFFTQIQKKIYQEFKNGKISSGEYYNRLELNLLNFCDYVTGNRPTGGNCYETI